MCLAQGRRRLLHPLIRCRHLSAASAVVPRQATLLVPVDADKASVIDRLRRHFPPGPGSHPASPDHGSAGAGAGCGHHDALVVITTPTFASWLWDATFMADLATAVLPESGGRTRDRETSALCAVVDALPAARPCEEGSGFSILSAGLGSLMPNLWRGRPVSAATSTAAGVEAAAVLTFRTSERAGGAVAATLPLANTIFQTGKQATLLAMRWPGGGAAAPAAVTVELAAQEIGLPRQTTTSTAAPLLLPMIPLTPPRRVTAGFGNMVRQIEVDGTAVPASTELERAVARVLQDRSPAPVAIWALITAEEVAGNDARGVDCSLPPEQMSIALSGIIRSGCRLHQVLSGGGGWGRKQGLLALDPETRPAPPDDEDVDMLIRSLEHRSNGENGGPETSRSSSNSSRSSVVDPGSYIQFFMPHLDDNKTGLKPGSSAPVGTWSVEPTIPSIVFGTPSHSELCRPRHAAFSFHAGLFGALSRRGVFLELGSVKGRTCSSKINLPSARIPF